MRKLYSTVLMLAMMVAALSLTACSSSDDDEANGFKQDYDVLIINGDKYACYGYRCKITYKSSWDFSNNSGKILLPCGKLSDAEKGEYDYDYMFTINLKGNHRLEKGSKLEDYSPTFKSTADNSTLYNALKYTSGSATITDKIDDKCIAIQFDSFKFGNDSKSYSLTGTVQLLFDED